MNRKMADSEDALLTTKQVAERLGVTRMAVHKWIRRGWPGAIRLGRDWLIPADMVGWWYTQNHSAGRRSRKEVARARKAREHLEKRIEYLLERLAQGHERKAVLTRWRRELLRRQAMLKALEHGDVPANWVKYKDEVAPLPPWERDEHTREVMDETRINDAGRDAWLRR